MASSGIAGFIDYDEAGRPFMGLLMEEGGVQVKIYVAHKDNAMRAAAEIGRQLNVMAADLGKMKNKTQLIAANGAMPDGALRE